MAGKGFEKVYNLSGGIKAWNNEIAIGPQDIGMELFSGKESTEETIIIGFGLEHGLREFYLDMKERVTSSDAKNLFTKLADIEIKERSMRRHKMSADEDKKKSGSSQKVSRIFRYRIEDMNSDLAREILDWLAFKREKEASSY